MVAERILVLGANGQVGSELKRSLQRVGSVRTLDRQAADLANPESLRAVVKSHQPTVIVNAAAYTAVDRAESEADLADTVNGTAPRVLAETARELNALIVHYSTDYVFDGSKSGAYRETDTPNPLSVYGRSKLAGDLAIRETAPRHLILRVTWVYAAHGNNFLKTMLRLAGDRDSLRVVADQTGTPTGAALIADVTADAILALQDADTTDDRYGTYHLTPEGHTNWCDYARYVIQTGIDAGIPLKATPERVSPIATADYPTPARRPANSRLDTTRLRSQFGITLPDWKSGVDDVIATLAQQYPR